VEIKPAVAGSRVAYRRSVDQVLANGIVAGCLYALVAYGFALIYNTTRTFHFAHGAAYAFCIYMLYTLRNIAELPLWLAILLSVVLTALLGIAIDEFVYRPLVERKSSLLLQLLSSLAVYMIVVNVIIMFYGNEAKVLNPEIQRTFTFGNIILSAYQVATVICALALIGLVALGLRLTRLGRLIRALRDDVELITILGRNPRHLRWLVFALGSALAGVAAVLQGLDIGTYPHAGMIMFLNGAVAVIIGGKGIFEAGVFGALIVGVLHTLAVWEFSARWEESAAFLLLVIFLLLRPEGIFGRTRRVEELEA
jgi:branched-chain amino acid transport system permease protein